MQEKTIIKLKQTKNKLRTLLPVNRLREEREQKKANQSHWILNMKLLSCETELKSPPIQPQKPPICVLYASSYAGFWIVNGLLKKGYKVHAAVQKNGKTEILKRIREMVLLEERLKLFFVDVLDYRSITEALSDCSALFCSLCSSAEYDETIVDLEVRGAINVVEACAQIESVEKLVFTSSLAAGIWRENISLVKDVDERSWSDPEFCRRLKLWYPLAKTLSEKAAWALAMDRMVNMVSINPALLLGPAVVCINAGPTMSYLKGAAQMCENGVMACVDVDFLVKVHIRALEDNSTSGRYFCFNQVLNTEKDAIKLAQSLSPLISVPKRYVCDEDIVYEVRLRNKKLEKMVEGMA